MQTSSDNRINEAQRKASLYEWASAAEAVSNELDRLGNSDPVSQADLMEFLARCNFKGSFQAESREKFVQLMQLAQSYYDKASLLYKTCSRDQLGLRCSARSVFAGYWMEEDFEKRTRLIRDCISLGREAKNNLRENRAGDVTRIVADLLSYYRESLNLSSQRATLNQQFEDALAIGRELVNGPEKLETEESTFESLGVIVWLLAVEAQIVHGPDKFKGFEAEAKSIAAKIRSIAGEVSTPFAASVAFEAEGSLAFDFEGDYSRAIECYEHSLEWITKTGDRLHRGRVSWLGAQVAYWHATNMDNIENKRTAFLKGLAYAEDAIQLFAGPKPTSDLAAVHASCAECHIELANQVETSIEGKEQHLRLAIESAKLDEINEEDTWGWTQVAHSLSKAMYFLARLEGGEEKNRILIDALPVREKTVRVADELFPQFWNRVVMGNYSALLKSELAIGENDSSAKIRRYQEAVEEMERCLQLGKRLATSPGTIRRLAQYAEWFADVLFELFSLTKNNETANRAIDVLETSIDHLKRCNSRAELGSVNWKIARTKDALGDFESASSLFNQAAAEYRSAAASIPGSASTYEDLALYMDAWAHTETARLNHAGGDFGTASEEYAISALKLENTKNWNHLTILFQGQSLLEKGEALSSTERLAAATHAFRRAEDNFQVAKNRLEIRLASPAQVSEKNELRFWMRIAEDRLTYSHSRALLEEARHLDRQGKGVVSVWKYQLASEGFRALKLKKSLPHPEEIDAMVSFCDAWGMMEQAESEASPSKFVEASEIFLRAANSPLTKFRLLAIANSHICRALEAGTKFLQNTDRTSYDDLKKWLESAGDFYRKTGSRKSETWTRATEKLFDALIYLQQAEEKKNPIQKTESYNVAETHLELAARLFGEAGYPKKRRDTLSQLTRTKKERQLLPTALTTLANVATIPDSAAFPLTLPRGSPLGTERFEAAFVVGEFHFAQSELLKGSKIEMELDIANVGKSPAILIRVQNIASEALPYDEETHALTLENNGINLGGRRLASLQTLTIRVPLIAQEEGMHELGPRVFFADEQGNYRSYSLPINSLKVLVPGSIEQPESSPIELPQTGSTLPSELKLDSHRARRVLEYLVNEFLRDHNTKGLNVNAAGWRTMMGIAKELKIPKAALYGTGARMSPILAELKRRGLVDVRSFPNERGRGGVVKRVHISCDNLVVKEIVRQSGLRGN